MTETEPTTITDGPENGRPNATDDRRAERAEPRRTKGTQGTNTSDTLDVRSYLYRGALVVLVLLAVVALFQFYMSALAVIRTFVADQYRPLFDAAFNLVVLLATGIGISFVVRSMD